MSENNSPILAQYYSTIQFDNDKITPGSFILCDGMTVGFVERIAGPIMYMVLFEPMFVNINRSITVFSTKIGQKEVSDRLAKCLSQNPNMIPVWERAFNQSANRE